MKNNPVIKEEKNNEEHILYWVAAKETREPKEGEEGKPE